MLLDNIKNIKYSITEENRNQNNVKDIYRIYLNDRQIWEKKENIDIFKLSHEAELHHPLEIIWSLDDENNSTYANLKLVMEPLVNDTPVLLADIYWDNNSAPAIQNYDSGIIEYVYPGTLPREIHIIIDSKSWPFGCFIDTLKLYDHENYNGESSYYKIREVRIGGGIEVITTDNNSLYEPYYLTPGILLHEPQEDLDLGRYNGKKILNEIYHLAPIKPGLFDNINTLKTVRFIDTAKIIPKNLITSSSVDRIFIGAGVERIGVNAIKVINNDTIKRTVKLKFESKDNLPTLTGIGSIVGDCDNIRLICFCYTELLKDEDDNWDNNKLTLLNNLFQGIGKYEIYDINNSDIINIDSPNSTYDELFLITDVITDLESLLVTAKAYTTENQNDTISYKLVVNGNEVATSTTPNFDYDLTNGVNDAILSIEVNVYVNEHLASTTINSFITRKFITTTKLLVDENERNIVASVNNQNLKIEVIEVEQ